MNTKAYRTPKLAVSTVKKSQARTAPAWARRNSDHVGPVRRGAGPIRFRRRTRRIVEFEEIALAVEQSGAGEGPVGRYLDSA
jgi:hypothetical protein